MQHSNPSWPLEGGHTMLNAALEYAAAYLPVFPCGLDKRPLIPDWPHRASTDSTQVIAWWTTWPEAMIGLVTGARSLLYVVDLDVKGAVDGIAAYLALGIPKAEIAARTPSGGGHAYYRWPGGGWNNTVAKIAPGIDTRGEGGYVIAPPSRSASGEYRWGSDAMHQRLLGGDVPELPAELRELLGPPGWPFRREVPATGSWESHGAPRRTRARRGRRGGEPKPRAQHRGLQPRPDSCWRASEPGAGRRCPARRSARRWPRRS